MLRRCAPSQDRDAERAPAMPGGNRPSVSRDAVRPVRVCIVAPSLDILGGQSVQAQRLAGRLHTLEHLEIGFLPINPRLPGPLRVLQRIKYVRTLVTPVRCAIDSIRVLCGPALNCAIRSKSTVSQPYLVRASVCSILVYATLGVSKFIYLAALSSLTYAGVLRVRDRCVFNVSLRCVFIGLIVSQ